MTSRTIAICMYGEDGGNEDNICACTTTVIESEMWERVALWTSLREANRELNIRGAQKYLEHNDLYFLC